jgi:uncharacterized repeat protein (TIGR03847 family)
MSDSFDITDPTLFTTGAVGVPGQRVFYLQAAGDGQVVTLRLEKQQVVALCDHLEAMMADLPEAATGPGHGGPLRQPTQEAWIVGSLGVAYEHAEDRILIVAEELVTDDDGDDDLFGSGPTGATARFRVPRSMVPGFIALGHAIAAAGRPLCDLCGNPMDPDGHPCPRLN